MTENINITIKDLEATLGLIEKRTSELAHIVNGAIHDGNDKEFEEIQHRVWRVYRRLSDIHSYVQASRKLAGKEA